MNICRLELNSVDSVSIKRKTILECVSGKVWMTVMGKDVILGTDETYELKPRSGTAVFLPLHKDTVVSVRQVPSFFQKFSLFNREPRFSRSLSGGFPS